LYRGACMFPLSKSGVNYIVSSELLQNPVQGSEFAGWHAHGANAAVALDFEFKLSCQLGAIVKRDFGDNLCTKVRQANSHHFATDFLLHVQTVRSHSVEALAGQNERGFCRTLLLPISSQGFCRFARGLCRFASPARLDAKWRTS